MVSGTVSLPYLGYFSLSAHATGSLPVVGKYLALRGGPREFTPGFPCPVLLGKCFRVAHSFKVQDYHPLWLFFPEHSPNYIRSPCGLMTPQHALPRPLERNGHNLSRSQSLGSSRFARRY
jgi:hypothetical protein